MLSHPATKYEASPIENILKLLSRTNKQYRVRGVDDIDVEIVVSSKIRPRECFQLPSNTDILSDIQFRFGLSTSEQELMVFLSYADNQSGLINVPHMVEI